MKLTRLNEAPLFTGSSFDRDTSWRLEDLIKKGAWREAYEYASSQKYLQENPGQTNERGQDFVLDSFVQQLPIKKEAYPVLKFICKSLSEQEAGAGFDRRKNPFLLYIEKGNPAKALDKEDWIALNNLYANEWIDPNDLYNSEGKTEGILFEPTLFENATSEDVFNLVRAYVEFNERFRGADVSPEDLQKAKYKVFYGTTEPPEKDRKLLLWPEVRANLKRLEDSIQADDFDIESGDKEWASEKVKRVSREVAQALSDQKLTASEKRQALNLARQNVR